MRTIPAPIAEPASFVGRKQDLERLLDLSTTMRMVTVIGIPGVGKSRLLSEFVRVSQRSHRRDVIVVRPTKEDGAGELRDAIITAATAGAPGPAVLVIDDAEHIELGPIVADLLLENPDTRVVVGRTRRLGLAVETILPLVSLAIPDPSQVGALGALARQPAMALLLDRAAAVAPGFVLTSGNAADLIAICALADGHPLTLEIAASRLRALSAAQVRRLLEAPDLIQYARPQDAPNYPRLETGLERVFRQLDRSQQEIWMSAAVFSAPFTLEDLQQLGSHDQDDPLDLIVTSLVDSSVLVAVHEDDVIRYYMPRHAQLYGRNRAAAEGELNPLLERRLGLIIQLGVDSAAGVLGERQAHWFDRFSRERTTIIDALSKAADKSVVSPETVAQTIAALRYFWLTSGDLPAARNILRSAMSSPSMPINAKAQIDWVQGFLAVLDGDGAAAQVVLSRLSSDNSPDQPTTRFLAAISALHEGEVERADARFDDLRASGEIVDPVTGLMRGEIIYYAGLTKFLLGDELGLKRVCADSWDEQYGADRWAHTYMRQIGALSEWRSGSPSAAQAELFESARTLLELRDRSGTALALEFVAWIDIENGRFDRAAQIYGAVENSSPVSRSFMESTRTEYVNRIRSELGESRYNDAINRGAATGLDALISSTIRSAPPAEKSGVVLTGRELEIVRLIARGHSNTEIAARLVISRRTVEGHMRRILAKLDFTSRTQVATWYVQFFGGDEAGASNRR